MDRRIPALFVVVVILTAGYGQFSQSEEPDAEGVSIEASVGSPPDDATVIDYNASTLDDKPGIKEIVRQKVDFYENGWKEGGIQHPINSTVLEEYRDLNTSYVEYRGVVVRVALLEEQEE